MNDLGPSIEDSKRLANLIGEQIDGLQLKADKRTRVSAALISVGLGHHASIIELFSVGRHASALALIRSMIDCLVRAQWLAHLANDEEVNGFIAGNDPLGSTPRLVQRLEEDGPLEKDVLSTILSADRWATVCDFNHGGARMVVKHLKGDEISPNFANDELEEALGAANAWALVSACALADLAGDRVLGDRLLRLSRNLAA